MRELFQHEMTQQRELHERIAKTHLEDFQDQLTTQVGSTLTVSPGTWNGSPTSYQYTWQRCAATCASIASAWNPTYAPVNADRGATLRVLVWAVNTAGHTTAYTAQTAAVS